MHVFIALLTELIKFVWFDVIAIITCTETVKAPQVLLLSISSSCCCCCCRSHGWAVQLLFQVRAQDEAETGRSAAPHQQVLQGLHAALLVSECPWSPIALLTVHMHLQIVFNIESSGYMRSCTVRIESANRLWSSLWSPKGKVLDIRKTSDKKLGKFLRRMQSDGYVTVKETSKGVDSITDFDKQHLG